MRLVLVAIGLYILNYRLACSIPINSDGVGVLMFTEDFLKGNFLLRGWTLSATPGLAEIPLHALGIMLWGFSLEVARTSNALIYTAAVLMAACLAVPPSAPQQRWSLAIIFLMLAVPSEELILQGMSANDHMLTVLLCICSLLLLHNNRRFLFAGLLLIALLHDHLVIWVLVVPLCTVGLLRWLSNPPDRDRENALLILFPTSMLVLSRLGFRALHDLGGCTFSPVPMRFVDVSMVGSNLVFLLRGMLALSGADFFGHPLDSSIVFVAARLLFAWLLVDGWHRVVCRGKFGTFDVVSQTLAIAMAINAAGYVFSTVTVALETTRYLLPLYVFGAILAARVSVAAIVPAVMDWSSQALRRRRTLAIGCGLVATTVAVGFCGQLFRPPAPQPAEKAVSWLEAHNLRDGLGDYWSSNLLTATSCGRVRVRAIRADDQRLWPYLWNSKMGWYQEPAHFLIFGPDDTNGPVALATLRRLLGKEVWQEQIGRYIITIWSRDISNALTPP